MGTARRAGEHQRSFEDMGAPLSEVTFVVVDTETTGMSPPQARLTEIGAVKIRGGEELGTFATFVDPGCPIPTTITYMTGITQSMVDGAPKAEAVMAMVADFIGDAVIVGHNISFDMRFLDQVRAERGEGRFPNVTIDTLALARRLLAGECTNFRLSTLASQLRLSRQPGHRALKDALATADLFHHLVGLAGPLGVVALADLLALPRLAGHPQADKLRLTRQLPHAPGVYLFKNRAGEVCYVGKATDLRTRVRSYFSGDDRKKVRALLEELDSIEHIVCENPLQAEVTEARLIGRWTPRYNQRGVRWDDYAFSEVSFAKRSPRIAVVDRLISPALGIGPKGRPGAHAKANPNEGSFFLGPLPRRQARMAVAALKAIISLHRSQGDAAHCAPGECTASEVEQVAPCPRRIASMLAGGTAWLPHLLLSPLADLITQAAASQDYERAAWARDHASSLSTALRRQRILGMMAQAERLVVETPKDGRVVIESAMLVDPSPHAQAQGKPLSWLPPPRLPFPPCPGLSPAGNGPLGPAERAVPLFDPARVDEALILASWLEANVDQARIIETTGELSSPFGRIDRFEPHLPSRRFPVDLPNRTAGGGSRWGGATGRRFRPR